ncbi:MAG: autotransporter domain-containing protein, partial [Sphingomonadales bacterium]
IGEGSLILSNTNSYAGTTTITEGILLNDGTLTSDISIGVDGIFAGTGMTIGLVNVDGTFSPGVSINSTGTTIVTSTGTSTVTGTVTFNAGSTFLVGVDASGNSGLLDVTGAIDIQGGTLTVAPTDVNFGLQLTYTIASATGGITGAFDEVTSTLNFLAPSYEIIGNDIILTLDLIGLTPLAITSNQIALAGQIDSLLQDNPSQDVLDVVAGILVDFASAPQSLDQLTGEGFGTLSTSALAITNLRLQAVNNHLNEARLCHNALTIRGYKKTCDIGGVTSASLPSDGSPNSVEKAHWGNGIVWLQAYGGRATMSAGGSFNVVGLDLGYDRWVSRNILVGISAGYSRDQEKGFASLTSAEGKFLQFGAHTSITFSAFYFNGLANYSFGEFTTLRNIAFGSINRTAAGTFDASTFAGYAELGMDAQNDTVNFQPFVSLQYTDISRDGFSETGAGTLNLTVASEGLTSTQAAVGLRMSTLWDGGKKVTLKPELRARFIYEFGNAADIRTSLVNLAGTTASTITSAAGYDSAFLVGMGLDISDGADLHIVFDIDYLSSDEFDMWSGTGRIIWGF